MEEQREDAMSSTRFEVTKFDGTGNFPLWQSRVKDLLGQQGLLRTIKTDAVKPAKVDADDWAEMQIRAASTIRLSLADQVLYHVMDEESPSAIWETLEEQFLNKTAPNKLYLKQELYRMRMQEGANLTEHINTFNRVVSDLERIGSKVEDEDKALLMLVSLPKSYKSLMVTLTYGKSSITSSEVQTALLSYDQREKTSEEGASAGVSDGQGLVVKGNHGGKSKKKKGKPQCHHCKEWGHIRRFCPTYIKADGAANIAVKSAADSDCEVLVLASELFDEVWMLDSGSSYHVTSNKEWFSTYKPGDFGAVYQVDGAPQRIMGMGDIKIKSKDGGEMVLQDVRYVPRARKNLISLGELHSNGYIYRVDRDKLHMRVKKNKELVLKARRTRNNLYKVHVSIVPGGAEEEHDEAAGSAEATESDEGSDAGSYK